MMRKKTIYKKNYVSEIDQFLATFDKNFPKLSDSQQKEINKARRIAAQRDYVMEDQESKKIWDAF